MEQIQKRPFAQLIGQDLLHSQGFMLACISADCFCPFHPGSSSAVGPGDVVQWEYQGGETSLYHMGYSKGRLQVQMEGYYYLYSRLTLNVAEECSLVLHKVMKVTKAYDRALELMRSKR